MDEYLDIVMNYMSQYGFCVRDTYIESGNLDDYYKNGNQFNGVRWVGFDWIGNDDNTHVDANCSYELDGYESKAYDNYRIKVPLRFEESGRCDPIIHECVHFLQRNTAEDESSYVRCNEDRSNYVDYVSQSQEYQAFIVQIAYIVDYQSEYISSLMDQDDLNEVNRLLNSIKNNGDAEDGVALILLCSNAGVV
ncbi:hypothetical protein [Aestuariirhabdus sp. LZHN29]|uniref:hypothetical protein n=1 Tax=Aestuariirhabdus sp. LZHN29 TaxID=3417462 RepID=UPI003CEA770E